MLEHATLLIRPPGPDGARPIVEAEGGTPLGFAQARIVRRWWWPTVTVLEVREYQDAPLLFTLRGTWSWRTCHEVRDADGFVIGSLSREHVHDEYGRRFAVRKAEAEGRWSLLSMRGQLLGQAQVEPQGVRLTFAPKIEREPFVKMLVLAAALRWP